MEWHRKSSGFLTECLQLAMSHGIVYSTLMIKKLSFLALLLILGASTIAFTSRFTNQAQAQSNACASAQVNVEFRKYTGNDTGWKHGTELKIKVGEAIDVNCFAKNGSELLKNGVLRGKFTDAAGKTTTVDAPAKPEIRNFKITKAGKYTFTCSDGAKCSNTDAITVAATATAASPTPAVSPSATPSSTCTTYALSDLNKDCKTTIDDYVLFLKSFREESSKT